MIKTKNVMGSVIITENFFLNLVGNIISDCYGVVGMSATGAVQSFKTLFFKKETEKKGIKVTGTENDLVVDLHIVVLYGVNIAAIVKSIVHKVKYSVEETTGFHVSKVNVYVDGMVTE